MQVWVDWWTSNYQRDPYVSGGLEAGRFSSSGMAYPLVVVPN